MNRRLGWEVERFILALIVLLGILDFAGQLPPFFAYSMDVVGWTMIAYVIYVISPTELFFGTRHPFSDFAIVISYVIMSVKDLIGNAAATLPELIQAAPAYLKFTVTSATQGIPFTISQSELNAFKLIGGAIPERIVTAIAPHFSMSQQQIQILLVHESETISLLATPGGHNGMMLMFYSSLVQNAAIIQKVSLILGIGILLAVSIYAGLRIPVAKPSLLAVLKEEGKPRPMRILWVFLMLIGFFVIIFNLLFEWMTITNDAPLIVLAVIVLGVLFLIHHIHLSFDEMLETLGNLGDDLYAKTIHLFMESRTILLGISGFLVLHLLTDVGNYVAPSIFGWYDTIYVKNTAGSHEPLFALISASLTADMAQNAVIIAAYVLSTIGMIVLLSLPAVIWYKLFKLRSTGSHEHLPDWKGWHVGMVMALIAIYIITPVFDFTSLRDADIVGVNLTTQAIDTGKALFALGFGVAVLLGCMLISAVHDYGRRMLMILPFGAAVVFFGIYVYYYFSSSFLYYVTFLVTLIQRGEFLFVPIIFLLFMFTIVFFITGFLSFLYEIWRD
jgi:hypothetical protein